MLPPIIRCFHFYAQRYAMGDLLNPHPSMTGMPPAGHATLCIPKYNLQPKIWLYPQILPRILIHVQKHTHPKKTITIMGENTFFTLPIFRNNNSSPKRLLSFPTSASNNLEEPYFYQQFFWSPNLLHILAVPPHSTWPSVLLFIAHVTFSKTSMVKKLSCLN